MSQPTLGFLPDTNPLQIIREEQCSPANSAVMTDEEGKRITMAKSNVGMAKSVTNAKSRKSLRQPDLVTTSDILQDTCPCTDDVWGRLQEEKNAKAIDPEVIEKLLAEREAELRQEFHETLTKEVANLKEKFDYILHNEQVRASYMLREAHRERQEKIKALQSQLECKNLAGLMYVICTERKKSRMEKMKIVEEYTTYINCLHDILEDGRQTILNLSRGYKTAARLDLEWKEKIKSIVGEFQKFVEHYMEDKIDTCQYFFDVPRLIQSEAPKEDNPEENPIDEEPPPFPEYEPEKTWWEQLDGECRPFIMFGDMAEFDAPRRRETLKYVKAQKTAPKKWKHYAFNEMFLKSGCANAKDIKDVYFQRLPSQTRWECQGVQTLDAGSLFGRGTSDTYMRRATTASIDMRGTMGSILKLITASGLTQTETKATLLGARDSIEIFSATKLRESDEKKSKSNDNSQTTVKLPVGRRRTSFFEERKYFESNFKFSAQVPDYSLKDMKQKSEIRDESVSHAEIKIDHHDSLEVISHHIPDKASTLNEAKVCPMEECRKMRMDSFIHSLPSYMKVKPFTHIEQSFENYQACTPEQLEVLQQRIQEKKAKEKRMRDMVGENPLKEWTPVIHGVATQTSNMSMSDLPPCTCKDSTITEPSVQGKLFNVADLIPVKQQIDSIAARCLFDDTIDFQRFKVVGEESNASMKPEPIDEPKDFTSKRLYSIKKILKEHPSLCSLFQANAKC